MQDRDFKEANLKKINDILSEMLLGHGLNFCKMLIHDHKEDLSITAKYDPPKSFASLAGDKLSDANGFYYGVSPCLDRGELTRCISNLELRNEDLLDKYVHAHGDWFMVHSDQKDYLPAFAKYIVICMASNFGIRIKMPPALYGSLLEYLKGFGYSDAGLKTMLVYSQSAANPAKSKAQPKDGVLTIKGCPTDEVLSFLKRYRYRFPGSENAGSSADGKSGRREENAKAWELLDGASVQGKSISISEIYANHLELISGKVFYSGVLLKPTKIDLLRGTQENYKIQSLCFHFERSSYGTVFALDRNLTEHPALSGVRQTIIKMLLEDDEAQMIMNEKFRQLDALDLDDTDASYRMISAVNDYLEKSTNVNQISISANIITGDGVLLIGQRSASNIDAKTLYPGVNGNAEIADGKVSFYSMSVYEDYPTIQLDSERIDFFGEIGREAYGELKLNLPKQEWKCCGIVLIGRMPKEPAAPDYYPEPSRRMHFALLFEHHTDKTFLEVDEISAKASEAFETERYLGVNVKCETNRLTHFGKTIARGITGIVNQKDFIESIVALVLFLMAISGTVLQEAVRMDSLLKGLKEMGWTDALMLFLALLIVIITGVRSFQTLRQHLRARKKTRFITIYRGSSYAEVNERVKQALQHKDKKEIYPFHPAALACLRYYVDSVICDTFFPKDNR